MNSVVPILTKALWNTWYVIVRIVCENIDLTHFCPYPGFNQKLNIVYFATDKYPENTTEWADM